MTSRRTPTAARVKATTPIARPLPANIIEALADDRYFAGMMDGDTWAPWRTFLKGLFALPMDADDLARWTQFTGRTTAPERPFRNATTIVGRRGGKSRTLGVIGAYLACLIDHTPHLVPGETPVVGVLAQDRRQARIIMSYIKGTIEAAPALGAAFITEAAVESLTLKNGVAVEVGTASVAAPRGRTYVALFADETAFRPVDGSANPDTEVINAARHGLTTIPYSILLKASSPYAKRGVLYSDYTRYFGRDDAPVLVWRGSTEAMNASLIGDPLIAEVRLEDPERASGEFDAEFRSDISAFIERGAVEAVIMHGQTETPPDGMTTYVAFVDPSGGSADSFTMAIGHIDPDGSAVLDAIRERKPPFSPDQVVQEYAELLSQYRISRVSGDAYAGQWPRERFETRGISYELSSKTKNEIYLAFAPALNGRRVRLLDSPRLVGQLCGLDRRTARGGRDSIDHAPGSHDDLANSAAGVLVQLLEDRRPSLIRRQDLLTADRPAEHTRPLCFFAVVWLSPGGMYAAAVFSYSDTAPKLVLIDFDTGPWSPSVLQAVARRLDELCETARGKSRHFQLTGTAPHAILHAQDQLKRAATQAMQEVFAAKLLTEFSQAGGPTRNVDVLTINPRFLVDPARLVLSAAGHVAQAQVKMSQQAIDKAAGQPLLGSLALKPGEDVTNDPLRVAMLVAIAQLDQSAEWSDATDGAKVSFK